MRGYRESKKKEAGTRDTMIVVNTPRALIHVNTFPVPSWSTVAAHTLSIAQPSVIAAHQTHSVALLIHARAVAETHTP